MYALAAHEEKDENSARWMDIAKGITNTCHESYDRSDTKLGPEAFRFTDAVEARALKANERYYILRPETFESYFIMWRLTHDQKYRDWGWEAVEVKYSQFSVTQILREINFGESRSSKTEVLAILGALKMINLESLSLQKKMQTFIKITI